MSLFSRSLLVLVPTLLLLSLPVSVVNAAASFKPGIVASEVITLTAKTIDNAVQDSANPLWLLKFYAPWCGHCKKLAPILEKVAPFVAGKLAIGTIDCTVEKKLCDQNGIRGYPTLKFTMDGEFFDYPGGRTADEIIAFAEKLAEKDVQVVTTIKEVMDQLVPQNSKEDKVVFVVHHPEVKGESVEDKLQSTPYTQVFAQLARKHKVYGNFYLLDGGAPLADMEGDEPIPPAGAAWGQTGAFVCRLEQNVAPRCLESSTTEPTFTDLLEFFKSNNIPTVSYLGPHNFNKMGKSGRPLVIGVIDADVEEQVQSVKSQLLQFATAGERQIREKYYYGWFDGKAFSKFLEQFNVKSNELPQVFVLDVPAKTFWQNSTYKLNVDDFLTAIANGSVKAEVAGKKGLEGLLNRFVDFMVEYRPYSVVLAVLTLAVVGIAILSILSPATDELRPPYPKKSSGKGVPHIAKAEAVTAQAAVAAASAAIPGEKNEAKKEK